MNKKIFTLTALLFLMFNVQAKLKYFQSAEELNLERKDLVTGYYGLNEERFGVEALGKIKLRLWETSSNFNASYFSPGNYGMEIELDKAISQKVIDAAKGKRIRTLVFRPKKKGGRMVYKLIGWSAKEIRFMRTPVLFPDLSGTGLIEFDNSLSGDDMAKRKLIYGMTAGESIQWSLENGPINSITVSGARPNFKINVSPYQEKMHLIEPLNEEQIAWLIKQDFFILVFEQTEEEGKFRLVGFSFDSFLY